MTHVQNEIKEASNIKDKTNRKCVQQVLTTIGGQLKLLSTDTLGEHGLLVLCGIDRRNCQIMEMIVPPNPVDEFFYQCSRRFEIERFEHLFECRPVGHVIFISGDECLIYQFSGQWKKIKSINALLIKRHHKGGQSSVRFARLAEESRQHYITHVIDVVNQLPIVEQKTYVFGGRELKEMFMTSPELKISCLTDDRYHTFDDTTIHEEYFRHLMVNPVFTEDRKIETIIELLERDPDYLLFTLEEIKERLHLVEYVVFIGKTQKDSALIDKNVIVLPINHTRYGRLKDYILIGKLYHK